MKTRIRHFRKLKGLTQSGLALRLSTTAATVSRLETADMTVSTDWLERIADALDVTPGDLIDVALPDRLVALGELVAGGTVVALPPEAAPVLTAETPADNPVLIGVARDLGPWRTGDLLVGDRHDGEGAMRTALGRDVIAGGRTETGFGRLIAFEKGDCLLAPPETGAHGKRIVAALWIAPLVMLVRRFPPLHR
ncbi:MAG: helix-turn-helix domain-containing protein [Parvibaculum sp.]|nr:helix-turn-helix domain-containing protein [Parvibaculum sp.]